MGVGAVVLVDFESVQDIDFSLLAGSRLAVFAGEVQRKVPIEVAMGLQALGERAWWVRSSGVGPNALDFHIAFELGRVVERGERGPVFVLSRDKGFDPLLAWLTAELGIPARRVTSLAEAFSAEPATPTESTPTPAQPRAALAHPTPVPAATPAAEPKPTAPKRAPTPAKASPAKTPARKTAQPQPGNGKKGGAKPSAELTRQILARSQKAARPRRRATLAKHIHAMFKAHAIAEREVESIIAKLIANRSISDAEGAITYHF